jgi:hypothetical protein
MIKERLPFFPFMIKHETANHGADTGAANNAAQVSLFTLAINNDCKDNPCTMLKIL